MLLLSLWPLLIIVSLFGLALEVLDINYVTSRQEYDLLKELVTFAIIIDESCFDW